MSDRPIDQFLSMPLSGGSDSKKVPFRRPSSPLPPPSVGVQKPAIQTRSLILGALARAYCHEGNTGKVLDDVLLVAAADEIMALNPTLQPEVSTTKSL